MFFLIRFGRKHPRMFTETFIPLIAYAFSWQVLAIAVYTIMFIIGLILNLVSLYHLVRKVLSKQSRNKNRMTILLINLAIADLMVIM